MTSLAEAYERNEREVTSPERLYAGTGLVLAGALLAFLAVLVVTTDLFSFVASDTYAARELAGILGGLAVPAVLVGVFTVLPAGRRAQAAAAISASLCLFGVALFWYAYPHHWDGYGQDLTFFVSAVYLVGLFSAIWCLFTVVVNFKTRNDPGGALEMNVTRLGETKVVEVDRSGGFSGVGFLGSTPDGEVETQTNDPSGTVASTASDAVSSASSALSSASSAVTSAASSGSSTRSGSTPTRGSNASPRTGLRAASDGGATENDIIEPGAPADGRTSTTEQPKASVRSTSGARSDAETLSPADSSRASGGRSIDPTDQYCGNCRHFEYGRDAGGMVPFCRYHGDRMDDMDPCDEWDSRVS